MLYPLFRWLDQAYDLPGAGVFQYITFRAAMAILLSLAISLLLGKRIIGLLRNLQVGESIRDLGLEGQSQKAGTPTMGGLLIIAALLIPTLLFARLDNIYVILLIVSALWMALIGFLDDYIKVFKKDKQGLRGVFKVLGQVVLGLVVGGVLFFHPEVQIKENLRQKDEKGRPQFSEAHSSLKTTIPFVKDNELDYADALRWIGDGYRSWGWLVFIPIVIFIVTAVSNAANLTDGIDGLATGTSSIIGITLMILAYVSGSIVFADYLDIMYIPKVGETVVFMGAFAGACIGFLWYNTYPAQVFMGDTGSLSLGGIIAVFAVIVRKELLIPLLCGIFLAENLSVVLQVSYFKYTKKKFGEGRRIFKMSPLHHHYQKLGMHESKIVTRFWIVGILLAISTIITLKLR
ncbi:phospho-N-acetylmuramoyl-pentapeptide-transferase [bacterium]|nr:phospho-N-acetylmuramoyl-pentapeptide-transferase [bacterium]